MLIDQFEYKRETLATTEEEVKPLLERHWQEIALNKDKIKLNPDWERYHTLEDEGMLGIYTVREYGELVGYFVVIADTNLHYKDDIFAVNDIIYLDPNLRNKSIGKKLIQFAIEDLKKLGVKVVHINTKVHQPFDGLMESIGFKLIERSYGMYIGD